MCGMAGQDGEESDCGDTKALTQADKESPPSDPARDGGQQRKKTNSPAYTHSILRSPFSVHRSPFAILHSWCREGMGENKENGFGGRRGKLSITMRYLGQHRRCTKGSGKATKGQRQVNRTGTRHGGAGKTRLGCQRKYRGSSSSRYSKYSKYRQ